MEKEEDIVKKMILREKDYRRETRNKKLKMEKKKLPIRNSHIETLKFEKK